MKNTFTSEELEVLKKKCDSNQTFQMTLAFGVVVLSTVLPLIPLRLSRNGVGALEGLNYFEAFLICFIFLLLIWLGLYRQNVWTLKKDLQHQEKESVELKVKAIEDVTKWGDPTGKKELIFTENKYEIPDFVFEVEENPEYLKAKIVMVERAKYSKYVFRFTVIEENRN